MTLESALKEINNLKPGQHFTYRDLAKRHCCCRTTLSRNHKGKNASHAIKAKAQLLLNERDEIEVVQYIKGLTERHVMPTGQMIVNLSRLWLLGSLLTDGYRASFIATNATFLLPGPRLWKLFVTRPILSIIIAITLPFCTRRLTNTKLTLRIRTIWMRRAS